MRIWHGYAYCCPRQLRTEGINYLLHHNAFSMPSEWVWSNAICQSFGLCTSLVRALCNTRHWIENRDGKVGDRNCMEIGNYGFPLKRARGGKKEKGNYLREKKISSSILRPLFTFSCSSLRIARRQRVCLGLRPLGRRIFRLHQQPFSPAERGERFGPRSGHRRGQQDR